MYKKKKTRCLVQTKASLPGRKYAEDKPQDCRYCYYWTYTGCSRRTCFYLLPPEKAKEGCAACAYGQGHPCIGYCIKDVIAR